jgi:hypothetical protein
MSGPLKFLAPGAAALHSLCALALSCSAAALIGFGAFAIGSALSGSYSLGIAVGSLASACVFPTMFSMLPMPGDERGVMDDKAPSLRKVFSGLF